MDFYNIIIMSTVLGIATQGLLNYFVFDLFKSWGMYFLHQISSVFYTFFYYNIIFRIVEMLKEKGFFERL